MARTQKITTYLWFNANAEEAVEFYTSAMASRSVGADRVDERSRPEGIRTRRASPGGHAEDRHRQSAAGAPGRVAAI
jgi:uncharacterized glyoxalase superfamily protein PhnB